MEGTFLLTIENVVQVSEDLLVSPLLPAEKYYLVGFARIQLLKSDGQIVEMSAEARRFFSRPPSDDYMIWIFDAKAEDVPVGSQIWIG